MNTSNFLNQRKFNLDEINPQKQGLFASLAVSAFMPPAFDDSTNQLFELTMDNGEQGVIKQCHAKGVEHSDFWIGMKSLFSFDYPQSMGDYPAVYKLLERKGAVAVPKLLACDSATADFVGFLYCSKLPNQALLSQDVSLMMVEQLAQHLAQLHQVKRAVFGSAFNPVCTAQDWWPAVLRTLRLMAEKKGVVLSLDDFESQQACPECFVPIMVDLRWDQFLTDSHALTGLVDLDAFAFGAVELEFVLLEYLLSEQQIKVFKQVYTQYNPIPDLTNCRKPYRYLLFFMNVLGEKSLDAWMQAPKRF
ncbi:MAG: phosphotransferase [Thiotrichales bacterium]|nr:phosphotransferase [Thiotrichales bacterium]